MALWRARTLESNQKARIAEHLDDDVKPFLPEGTGSYLVAKDIKMTKVYSAELPMNVSTTRTVNKLSLAN